MTLTARFVPQIDAGHPWAVVNSPSSAFGYHAPPAPLFGSPRHWSDNRQPEGLLVPGLHLLHREPADGTLRVLQIARAEEGGFVRAVVDKQKKALHQAREVDRVQHGRVGVPRRDGVRTGRLARLPGEAPTHTPSTRSATSPPSTPHGRIDGGPRRGGPACWSGVDILQAEITWLQLDEDAATTKFKSAPRRSPFSGSLNQNNPRSAREILKEFVAAPLPPSAGASGDARGCASLKPRDLMQELLDEITARQEQNGASSGIRAPHGHVPSTWRWS